MSSNKDDSNGLANYANTSQTDILINIPNTGVLKQPNVINTKEELYDALAISRKQCEDGKIITLEEFKAYWEKKIGKLDV